MSWYRDFLTSEQILGDEISSLVCHSQTCSPYLQRQTFSFEMIGKTFFGGRIYSFIIISQVYNIFVRLSVLSFQNNEW